MISEALTRGVRHIQGERFGTIGDFVLEKFVLPIQTETVGKVDYSAHIIRREHNPHLGNEEISGEKRQMILLSGLDTTGQDWLRMSSQLMMDMPDVEQITLLDHPSTSMVRHERRDAPLNTTSFENSAKVISKAMEQLLEQGKIQTGQTAIGISTGCAVLEEVAVINPKLIDTLVLCAPAGMLDRTEKKVMKGGAHGGTDYLKDFFIDLKKRFLKKLSKHPSSKVQGESIGIVKSIPHTSAEQIPKDMLKPIQFSNFMFEVVFKALRKFPNFYQHFTGMWGDSNPHVPVVTADYKKDVALISKNSTENACKKISGKRIVLALGMEDQAVPPQEFLREQDKQVLSSIQDSNIKAEKTIDMIISNIKQRFPHNIDTTVMLGIAGPVTHVQEKTNTEIWGPMIANILEPIKPKLSLEGDALKEWFGTSR